jgi:nucleoside 2-deoxyribosyltransferase
MLVFLGGPVRSEAHRAYLEELERIILQHGYEVWVPHKQIGVIPKTSSDLGLLRKNFEALRICDVAVFVLDSERTGTGIEIGFLYSLLESGASSAAILGVFRDPTDSVDLMARFCIDRYGALLHTSIELGDALTRFAPH